MPKESFKQPIKKEEPPIKEMEKKLDKAEKMVERVKEDLKEGIEEHEMVEKPVKELKKLWEENKAEIVYYPGGIDEMFLLCASLPLPKTSPFLLERIFNKFLKESDLKRFEERVFLERGLGFFLSAFLNKNIENYISSQKKKGIKEENIKPVEVHLKVEELPVRLGYLGYQNPEKLHLIIKGNCGDWTGAFMKGGKLNIKGKVESFATSTFSPDNKGTIIWKNTEIWRNGNWTKEGMKMQEEGEIPMEW